MEGWSSFQRVLGLNLSWTLGIHSRQIFNSSSKIECAGICWAQGFTLFNYRKIENICEIAQKDCLSFVEETDPDAMVVYQTLAERKYIFGWF
jgi:hypothetical protein